MKTSNNKIYYLITVGILMFCYTDAQTADWQWAYNFGGAKDDGGAEVIASNGSMYVAGYFGSDSIRLIDTTLRNTLGGFYMAKMDKQGNLIWAKTSNGGGYMVMDSASNIYRIIGFTTRIVLDGDTMRETQPLDVSNYCIAKFDSNGNKLWMQYWTPLGKLEVKAACADNNGNLYAAGYISRDTVYINGDTLASTRGGQNIVVLKFDATGHIAWAKAAVPNIYANQALAIASDGEGHILVSGYDEADSLTIDSAVLPHRGMFLLKLTENGNVVWLKGINGYSSAPGKCIAINKQEKSIYVSGSYYGGIGVGTDTILGRGIFTSKFNYNGDLLWLKVNTATSGYIYNSVDNAGNVLVAGDFSSLRLIFGNDTLENLNYSTNLFLVKYDTDGNVLSATGTMDYAYVFYMFGFAADEDGNAYLSGVFDRSSVTFGNYTLHNFNTTEEDIFLAKYSWNIVSGITAPEAGNNSFTIYPNPCANNLYIKVDEKNAGSTYRIYDVSARPLLSGSLSNSIERLDIKRLVPGMYFFELTTDGKSTVSKFVVQHQ